MFLFDMYDDKLCRCRISLENVSVVFENAFCIKYFNLKDILVASDITC